MKKQNQRKLGIAIGMLAAFFLWTAAVSTMDVRAIGPNGSSVGFAALNGFVHNLTGVNFFLYTITDWLSLVPGGIMLSFAVLGLGQWIKRKRLLKVDRSILALGGYYAVVMGAFLFFETFVVNYRPVLINGVLEASYPSSTTLLVLTVMPTAIMQLNVRISNPALRRCAALAAGAFTAFMVIGRLVSGVHWITDIIGGGLLSGGLVLLYDVVCGFEMK